MFHKQRFVLAEHAGEILGRQVAENEVAHANKVIRVAPHRQQPDAPLRLRHLRRRFRPAIRRLRGKCVCAYTAGFLQRDVVAEAFELSDEASGDLVGVAALEVVAAGLAIDLSGAEHVPDGGQDRVLDGADRAAVPDSRA